MRVRFEGRHVRSRTIDTYDYRVEYQVVGRRLQWLALVERQGRIWVFKGQLFACDAGTATTHPIDTVTHEVRHEIDAISQACQHRVMSCNACGLVCLHRTAPGAVVDREAAARDIGSARMRAAIHEGQELRSRACTLRLASTRAVERLLRVQREINQGPGSALRSPVR